MEVGQIDGCSDFKGKKTVSPAHSKMSVTSQGFYWLGR